MRVNRVALVGDQSVFRAGVRILVDSQADLEIVGEAGNGVEAVPMAAETCPGVILMDITMPVMDGIAATAEVLKRADARGRTPPHIIVLTIFDLDKAWTRAIRAGASGFVLTDADTEFLLSAIRRVHAGNGMIAASATRELVEYFTPTGARSVAPAALEQLTCAGT